MRNKVSSAFGKSEIGWAVCFFIVILYLFVIVTKVFCAGIWIKSLVKLYSLYELKSHFFLIAAELTD